MASNKRKTNNSNPLEDSDEQEIESEEELFIIDLFQGDINPGIAVGWTLFNQATKSIE